MTERADGGHSVARTNSLPRFFFFDRQKDVTSCFLVERVEATHSMESPWQRRIVEVADGRPTKEIVEVLYQEQLDRGARLTDLGMWKSLFDRRVTADIGDLVHRGVIDINPDGGLERRSELPTTWESKQSRLTFGTISENTDGQAGVGGVAGAADSRPRQTLGNPANEFTASQYANPQKWSASPRVKPGSVGVGQSALSQNAIVSSRSGAGVVLGFLARVARRGSRGIGRLRSHTMETEGR